MSTGTETPPAQAEAEGIATIDVDWRGMAFTVPTDPDDWPVAAQLALEESRIAAGLRSLLPAGQWAAFMSTGPRNRDTKDLASTITVALGFGSAGE